MNPIDVVGAGSIDSQAIVSVTYKFLFYRLQSYYVFMSL